METLSGEFNPIASEKYEFGKRQNKNMSWTFLNVQPINIPIQGTKSEIVLIKSYLKRHHRQFTP